MQHITELMRRQAKLNVLVHMPVCSENVIGVRNKVQMPFTVSEGKIDLGFYQSRSHRVIVTDYCPMQSPLANIAKQAVLEGLEKRHHSSGLSVYDESSERGLLRHLVIRTNTDDSQVQVVLVINGTELPGGDHFADELIENLPQVSGVILNINQKSGNRVMGQESIVLRGKSELQDSIGSFTFYLSAGSFFQTNRFLTETLYRKAMDLVSWHGNELVLEAYSGTGSISLFLAERAGEVLSVELNAQAIRDARRNSERNQLQNISFLEGAAEKVIPELLEGGRKPEVILVDPPRQGCSPVLLKEVIASKTPYLIYISCNPATLARDAALLCGSGYSIGEIHPVDMFPWTEHIECVCCFTLKEK
jgi:23S rRNA (uracil1939-C5)-methyltransferase